MSCFPCLDSSSAPSFRLHCFQNFYFYTFPLCPYFSSTFCALVLPYVCFPSLYFSPHSSLFTYTHYIPFPFPTPLLRFITFPIILNFVVFFQHVRRKEREFLLRKFKLLFVMLLSTHIRVVHIDPYEILVSDYVTNR